MSATIKIRPAHQGDLPQLVVLCGQLGYPCSETEVAQRLEWIAHDPDHALLVAESPKGAVIGWVHGFIRTLLISDKHIEIGGLVVDQNWRGQRIGEKLLTAMEAWTQQLGYGFIYVRSNAIRTEAHRFYDRLGYDRIKTSLTFKKMLSAGLNPTESSRSGSELVKP